MTLIKDHLFLLDSFVIWSIFFVAVLSYGLLLDLCVFRKHDRSWYDSTVYWTTGIKQMLAALPLLGLLGTISGLLSTFMQMSRNNGFAIQEILTGGIAEAMFTTQLGLVMVVPGILILVLLNKQKNDWLIRCANEVNY